MNKKFSTLLVAFVAMGVGASALTLPKNVTEASAITSGEYYYLSTGVKSLSITPSSTNKDSLVLVASATDAQYAQLTDAALWTIEKKESIALGDYYIFTNVKTGSILKLDKKGNGIISTTGTYQFGWDWVKGTSAPFTNITSAKTYTVTAAATTDSISLAESATVGIQNFKPMVPAWRKMTANELNSINGSSFKWTVSGTTSTSDLATKSADVFNKNAFVAVGTTDATPTSADTEFYLKKLKSDKATKAAYLNVDTVYYTRTGALIDSTLANGGLIFNLDTLTSPAMTPKAGKHQESFQFSVWTNVKGELVIETINIPTANKNETFAQQTINNTNGYVTLVGFDGASVALTASAPATSNKLATVEFGAGTKVELPAGAYYIYNKDKSEVYVGLLASTLDRSENKWVKAGEESALVAATQWSLASKTTRPIFYNRENAKAYSDVERTLYSSDQANVYYYGADTLTIMPVQTEGIYVGYKKFAKTAAEEAVTKVALQFHSVLTGDNTAFVYTSDSILAVKNMDKDDALYFNIASTDTFKIGKDSLVRVSYKLSNKDGYLTYDDVKQAYKVSDYTAATDFVFRATNVAGKYQILPTLSANNAAELNGQVSVAGTSALLVQNPEYALLDGFFSMEAPLDPVYATIAGVPNHKRIASVENPTLAISMNADSCGVLKAVSELKAAAFDAQNFSMFMDVYDNDEVKPLYLISTQQTLALTADEKAKGVRFFMFNTGKKNVADLDSVGFKKAMRIGTELDSLHVYNVAANKDTVKPSEMNPYTFAFRKTANTGEYLVENQIDKKYLAQKNGILHLVIDTDNALMFTVNEVTAENLPTDSEDINAAKVTVVAVAGGVNVLNANGKAVTISNILGQSIVNTAITSDNVTINVPAGVVVVAVEGETAVKAIVK